MYVVLGLITRYYLHFNEKLKVYVVLGLIITWFWV